MTAEDVKHVQKIMSCPLEFQRSVGSLPNFAVRGNILNMAKDSIELSLGNGIGVNNVNIVRAHAIFWHHSCVSFLKKRGATSRVNQPHKENQL